MCRSRFFFRVGGRGIPSPTARKQSGQRFFLSSTYFTVYRGGGGGPMVLLQRKLYFSKDPEGVQYFPRGGGGPNANFYRNPYNLRFSR